MPSCAATATRRPPLVDRPGHPARTRAHRSTGPRSSASRRPARRPAHLPVPAPALLAGRADRRRGAGGRPERHRSSAAGHGGGAARRTACCSPAGLGRDPAVGWPTTRSGRDRVARHRAAGPGPATPRTLGLPTVEELTLHAPLVLPADGARQNSRVDGGRSGAVVDAREATRRWLDPARHRHAGRPGGAPETSGTGRRQRPNRCRVDYGRLADAGYGYGPDFRVLGAVWRTGDELVRRGRPGRTGDRFGLHPALLDAALHPLALDCSTTTRPGCRSVVVGGRARGRGGALRARFARTGAETAALTLTDADGPAGRLGDSSRYVPRRGAWPTYTPSGSPRWRPERVAAHRVTIGRNVGFARYADLPEPGRRGAPGRTSVGRGGRAAAPLARRRSHRRRPGCGGDRPVGGPGRRRAVGPGAGRPRPSTRTGSCCWTPTAPRSSTALVAAAVATGEPQLVLRDGAVGCPGWPGRPGRRATAPVRPATARCWSPAPRARSAAWSPATW